MSGTDGARVLVTGASQGIGKAIMMRLAGSGWPVLGISRSKPEIPASAPSNAARRITWTQLDLSNPSAVEQYAESLVSIAIRAVILSAVDYGDDGRHPASATTTSEWQRVIATNLIGQCILVSRLLPKLAAAAPGIIINISSDVAVAPAPGRSAYAASKAGLHAMLRAVGSELSTAELSICQLIPSFQTITNGIRRRRPSGFDFSSYAEPELIAEVIDRIMASPADTIPNGSYIVRRDGALEKFEEVANI